MAKDTTDAFAAAVPNILRNNGAWEPTIERITQAILTAHADALAAVNVELEQARLQAIDSLGARACAEARLDALTEECPRCWGADHLVVVGNHRYNCDTCKGTGRVPLYTAKVERLRGGIQRIADAKLSQAKWEDDEDIVLLDGKPVGGTISSRDRIPFDRWWPDVKRELTAALLASAGESE